MFGELKLKIFMLSMKLFGGKIMSKKIYKETGYKTNIRFNDLRADVIGNKVILHCDMYTVFNDIKLK